MDKEKLLKKLIASITLELPKDANGGILNKELHSDLVTEIKRIVDQANVSFPTGMIVEDIKRKTLVLVTGQGKWHSEQGNTTFSGVVLRPPISGVPFPVGRYSDNISVEDFVQTNLNIENIMNYHDGEQHLNKGIPTARSFGPRVWDRQMLLDFCEEITYLGEKIDKRIAEEIVENYLDKKRK